MLHSGSRNIGKEIAEPHIYKAKGLEHNLGLPDRDLAVFLSDTRRWTRTSATSTGRRSTPPGTAP